jgi:SAM-dependent methyltransferase
MTASSDRRADAFPWPTALYAHSLGGADRLRVFRHSPTVKLYRGALARHIRRGMRVLDLGCGYAIGGCHMAAIGGESLAYLGVDVDPAVCARAREVLVQLPHDRVRGEVVCSDATAFLTGSARRFDLVLCNYSLHACLRPTADARHEFGRSIAAVLRPDGLLIVADAFFDDRATAQEIERINDYAARAAARLCTGVHQPPGTLLPAQMEAIFLEAGLRLLERHNAPWFALSAYEGLRQARYALRVFAKPASPAR